MGTARKRLLVAQAIHDASVLLLWWIAILGIVARMTWDACCPFEEGGGSSSDSTKSALCQAKVHWHTFVAQAVVLCSISCIVVGMVAIHHGKSRLVRQMVEAEPVPPPAGPALTPSHSLLGGYADLFMGGFSLTALCHRSEAMLPLLLALAMWIGICQGLRLRVRSAKADSFLSIDNVALAALQVLGTGRLVFFATGHKYDFGTLQVRK